MPPWPPPLAFLSLAPGWRLVVLDTTEMSGHSDYTPDSEQYQEAQVGAGGMWMVRLSARCRHHWALEAFVCVLPH